MCEKGDIFLKRRKQPKRLFQEICIKTTLSLVFTGGVWQTEGGEKKTGGGVLEKILGWKKKTGRRRSPMLLEKQSDLVIHWLLRKMTAYNTSCIPVSI